ncbi:hypothetical protein PybrP1_010666 [[Pythium] brassicae (nom. inval.)]|nr:hypothetical protein PybrP1_010666 [[Pythium] brassicae (nom. inval.)]
MLALRRAAASAVSKRSAFSAVQNASFSSDSFREKERAAETAFFNKEDEKALRKLLQKMKGQTDVNDKAGFKDHIEHDTKGLKKIKGLELSKEQVDALLKWKHEH